MLGTGDCTDGQNYIKLYIRRWTRWKLLESSSEVATIYHQYIWAGKFPDNVIDVSNSLVQTYGRKVTSSYSKYFRMNKKVTLILHYIEL